MKYLLKICNKDSLEIKLMPLSMRLRTCDLEPISFILAGNKNPF